MHKKALNCAIGALFIVIIVLFLPIRSAKPRTSENLKEILSLNTLEEPRMRVLPNGTTELRFKKGFTFVARDYVAVVSYSTTLANALKVNSEIKVYNPRVSVAAQQSGAYYIKLLTPENSQGEHPVASHTFIILVGPWPEPSDTPTLDAPPSETTRA